MCRAVDRFVQVIDVLVSQKRYLAATCWFFTRALTYSTPFPVVATDCPTAIHCMSCQGKIPD